MDAVADDRAIEGLGTTEWQWRTCVGVSAARHRRAEELVPAGHRTVVVAPHPDDEVLAIGGLLAQLGRDHDRELLLIAVTDGTASHEGSSEWSPERLALERPRESQAALRQLGISEAPMVRLGLPDGGVQASRAQLIDRLIPLLRPMDVVFTTWRFDGHPDHEATGSACATAAERVGAKLVEVPVWAWHWARVDDPRLPWSRARRIPLDDDAVRRKEAAVQAFRSQLVSDLSTGAGPILRSTTVERASRDFELVFT
ncbi:MAG: PIG-L family deacetylase [Pseudomonadota bacterium]